MFGGRCPACGALFLPGMTSCAGCGRFRYRWLTRWVLVLIAVGAVFALRRYGLLAR